MEYLPRNPHLPQAESCLQVLKASPLLPAWRVACSETAEERFIVVLPENSENCFFIGNAFFVKVVLVGVRQVAARRQEAVRRQALVEVFLDVG